MSRTAERPGLTLAVGVAVILTAALAPAGLQGGPTPLYSWCIWSAVLAAALLSLRRSGLFLAATLVRLAWVLPLVLLLALPVAFFAPPERRLEIAGALTARALAAASAGVALAVRLGPAGFVAGLRALRVPERLVEVTAAALSSLILVLRQVRAMLRSREARRPGYGAWSPLTVSPRRTVRGFGRLVAALLLRSLERAECLDRARRARGVGE
jgi:energy-coupling factor transporter transmembrane protein EcfT